MAEMTLNVKEATERGSIQTLESILLEMTGIERALVDTEDGEVKVTYDEEKVSKKDVQQKIQQHGLHVE